MDVSVLGKGLAWDNVNKEIILDITNDIRIKVGAGAPTDGSSGTGAGRMGKGSLYLDRTNGKIHINEGTKASPTYQNVGDIATADLADLAVTTAKLAVGVLSADAAGRALFATDVLDVATFLTAVGANAVVHSLLDEQVEHWVDIAIDAAALKTLRATAVELVAAPVSGKALIFTGAIFEFTFVTAAYDAVAADNDLAVVYTNPAGFQVAELEGTGFLDISSATATRFVRPHTALVDVDSGLTPVDNAALVLDLLGTTEIFSAAGAGTLKVRTFFRTIPTALP